MLAGWGQELGQASLHRDSHGDTLVFAAARPRLRLPGVVPGVQPQVFQPGGGGSVPGGAGGHPAPAAGDGGEPARQERQHSSALQRVPLQLPGGKAPAGHG